MFPTFTISRALLQRIAHVRYDELVQRLDEWLRASMPGWGHNPARDRHRELHRIVQVAHQVGITTELEYAVFARIVLERRPRWEAWLAAEPQQTVLSCPRRSTGAKLRELHRLAHISDNEAQRSR